jgi:hypothetical protein
MNRKTLMATVLALTVTGAGATALKFINNDRHNGGASQSAFSTAALAQDKPKATLYRNPNCSCCLDYAKYLRENGFDVTVDSSHDLASIRKQLGVPEKFEGCHVMTIGPYAVEGHVDVASINKLLAERPHIIGISIPGMPAGTPGMTGHKSGPLNVYEIGTGSSLSKVFSTE